MQIYSRCRKCCCHIPTNAIWWVNSAYDMVRRVWNALNLLIAGAKWTGKYAPAFALFSVFGAPTGVGFWRPQSDIILRHRWECRSWWARRWLKMGRSVRYRWENADCLSNSSQKVIHHQHCRNADENFLLDLCQIYKRKNILATFVFFT